MSLHEPARPAAGGRGAAPRVPHVVRRVAGGVGWRLMRVARPRPALSGPVDTVACDVAVFFSDGYMRLYQIEQWLPVLERLGRQRPTVLVVRHQESYDELTQRTDLPAVLLPTFRDLSTFYHRADPKIALYVNNGNRNFQSLSYPRMLHVHINHGESDKVSMVSNQAKAYDRVFVAGEAAVHRHRAALMQFDESRLVPVGRPQLDLELEPALPPSERATVLYAPTWEGEEENNNYTSLDRYGREIARAALSLPNVRFVYKPHPRVETGTIPSVLAAHKAIVAAVREAAGRDPQAGHTVASRAVDVLALIRQADLLVSDVSSVALDFLYLRTGHPLVITDRRNDRSRLAVDAPVSQVCEVVDGSTVARVRALLESQLAEDTHAADRERMRQFYFGDLQPGQSTERFLAAVDELAVLRDSLIGAPAGPASPSSPPSPAGTTGSAGTAG